MIKKSLLSLVLTIFTTVLCSASGNSRVAMADSAYNEKDYISAIGLYMTEIDSVGPSSDLFYNIGNCYYRTGAIGKAVVAYERALKLNPRNKDAATNLDFINSRLVDRPGERGTFIVNMLNSASDVISANGWAWIGAFCFILAAGGVLLYFFANGVMARKTGFFGGAAMLLLSIISVSMSVIASRAMTSRDRAVVIVPSAILSTTPRTPSTQAEEAMMLHEGAVVTIVDSVTVATTDSIPAKWFQVDFDNTHRAWINADGTEII